ncbi:hypothetical protein [Planococcus sp. S3-L1]|uniref:hypothetical protein n=1 Tax=Planococcus sp. S3-L1 TaxID=3046200 RepID=UPI0024B8C624|nr:hypothetical protein [Planococcus sp. S3-L1]MDJ0333015.1 hypothetical protein [Planococcus sp. S3-L1]
MSYLYIDEKGPQETIRASNPYNEEQKIKLGNDNMHVYVADVIKINKDSLSIIEENYKLLEKKYITYRNFDKELKGKDILDKNFKFGIASMKNREIDFYNSLMDLLLENQVDNLLLSINKMSLVADNRLTDWILELEKKRFIESAWLLKYSLVKYLEIEASASVILSIFDSKKSNREVLTEIQKDLKAFIERNKNINRMRGQIGEYKMLIQTIKTKKHLISTSSFEEVSFDWEKLSFDIDLWMTEMSQNTKFHIQSTELILDEGIPLKPFNKFDFLAVKEEEDSVDHVGLRISDVLIVFMGKMISKLANDVRYDKKQPEERKLLSKSWFALEEKQFELVKKMKGYFFPYNSTYCFVVDVYFDDAALLQAYFEYVSTYESFDGYKMQAENHVENHYIHTSKLLHSRWDLAIRSEKEIRKKYGSMSAAIEFEVMRPL